MIPFFAKKNLFGHFKEDYQLCKADRQKDSVSSFLDPLQ